MKVLVTGGSGFVGQRLKLIKPDWIYANSDDVNLLDDHDTYCYLDYIKPHAIIHLAAKVGGIKANAEAPTEFFNKNLRMNMNLVQQAFNVGVPRVLASLSSCAFPDVLNSYPFSEEVLLAGPPAETNLSYGFTKRALHLQIQAYRRQYGVNYSTFCPSNIYGPGDNFDLETSHFVPACIRKILEAEEGSEVEFWGTGEPLRQQLYVDDLARIIPDLLGRHASNLPLIVAPKENLSIKEMVNTCQTIIGKDVQVKFNGQLDGQYRKDGDNRRLMGLIPGFEFTTFEEGLKKTIEWYLENEDSIYNRN